MDQTSQIRRTDYDAICGEQEFFAVPLLQRAIADALDIVGKAKSESRALDVGAGECPLRTTLEGMGYYYCSLDIEQNGSGSIDYVAMIDRYLPEALAQGPGFDLIVCTEVLEHVADWPTAFTNIARLINPGGHVIVTTPFFYMLHEEPTDFWRPTTHALNHYASAHGFEVICSRRNGDGWDVLGTLLCSMSICRREKAISSYLVLFPAMLVHWLLKWILKTRVFQSVIDLQMRFYVGNLVIYKSPLANQANQANQSEI